MYKNLIKTLEQPQEALERDKMVDHIDKMSEKLDELADKMSQINEIQMGGSPLNGFERAIKRSQDRKK